MSTTGIYEIKNLVNGNRYIGSAVNLIARMRNHRFKLNDGSHRNGHLQKAWKKYGADVFAFNKLLICSPDNLLMYEQRCIDGMNPEYNICKVAGSQLGHKWSDDSRRKMVGNKNGAGNLGKSGRVLTTEERFDISQRMKGNEYAVGRVKTLEEIQAISKRMNGNTHAVGTKHTQHKKDTQRQFMLGNSFAKGFKWSLKNRAYLSEIRKGKSNLALKGKPWSEARRAAHRSKKCP